MPPTSRLRRQWLVGMYIQRTTCGSGSRRQSNLGFTNAWRTIDLVDAARVEPAIQQSVKLCVACRDWPLRRQLRERNAKIHTTATKSPRKPSIRYLQWRAEHHYIMSTRCRTLRVVKGAEPPLWQSSRVPFFFHSVFFAPVRKSLAKPFTPIEHISAGICGPGQSHCTS